MKITKMVFGLVLLGCSPQLVLTAPSRDGAVEESRAPDAPQPEDRVPEASVPDVPETVDSPLAVDVADVPEVFVSDASDAADVYDAVEVRSEVGFGEVFAADAGFADVRDAGDSPDVSDSPEVSDAGVDDVAPVDSGPPPCPEGASRCGDVCLDLRSTVFSCGACGMVCPDRLNAVSSCVAGSCTFVCRSGYADCNGNPSDGCEVAVDVDPLNCGACGNSCPNLPHAVSSRCLAGSCSFSCAPGFGDCNGIASDGCETSLVDSPANCGACGRSCGSTQVCVSGSCGCSVDLTSCGSSCTDLTADPANCGGCGRSCGPGTSCCNGVCSTLNTASHCGSCSSCISGQMCILNSCVCPAGYSICGSSCVNLQRDSRNCGRCGHFCSGMCMNGSC